MTIDLGFVSRTFSSLTSGGVGVAHHGGGSYMFKTSPQDDGATDRAYGAQMRITSFVGTHFYMGGDLEIADVEAAATSIALLPGPTPEMPNISQSGAFLLGGDVMLGYAGRATDRLELAAEMAAGVRTVGYSFDSTLGSDQSSSRVWGSSGMVEARARATYWVSPTMNVGAFVGHGFTDDGSVLGIAVGIASTPFGRG
ncbi:MAG TPA: hypothetical protein VGM90_32610 [Kofleriaceae bacterium]